jgi:hypothetical protein
MTSRSAEHPNALNQLLNPESTHPADPSDDEMTAALSQFINRRLTYATVSSK